MPPPYNGMPGGALVALAWRKGRRSNPSGNCVELARLPEGGFALRNSHDPYGPVLIYTDDEIGAFLASIRDGEFDDLL